MSGTVLDSTGAVIPNAKVVLRNDASAITRETTSNSVGFFHFAALPPGTYTVQITAEGFTTWTERNIVFNQGESHNLPNVVLKPGASTEVMTVEATPDSVPLQTGESRATLNTHMVSEIAITGRDAAELIRIMPGMAMNTGLSQKQWTSETTQTNSGPIGSFAANGTTPYGGMTMTVDGANIVDPGNQGTQIANINQDQTAEVTILNSAYGAEYAHGPVTFQAISKSGGKNFHGSAYLYARNGVMNSEDAYLKAQNVPKPDESYYYPGFTISGPVILPKLNFNRNRDKLFFFAGYEYMKQQPSGSLYQTVVPTDAMKNGDFSAAQVAGLSGDQHNVPCGDPSAWQYGGFCKNAVASGLINNGVISPSLFDPNGLALMKLMPEPNETPTANNPYNYRFLSHAPFNRWEFKTKLDYIINSSTTLTGSFNRQDETDMNYFGVWWWPSGTIPYPSNLPAGTISNTWSFNLTKTFGPSMTNETIFAYASYLNPIRPSNPAAIDPSKVGFTAKGPFSPDMRPQVPNIVSWGSNNGTNNGNFPNIYGPGFASDFYNGAFGTAKNVPSIADNVSKVWRSHTMKFGFYWDQNTNRQGSGYGNWGQGMYEFDDWWNGSTTNLLADLLIGQVNSYSQVSAVPAYNARYHEMALYAQDQWKITHRLTVTYGLRLDHEGQWYATSDQGFAVWDPSVYDNTPSAPSMSGILWNGKDSKIPISGYPSPTFYPSPRVGAAYDLFGNGKTVLRGGFGMYRWQFAYNTIGNVQGQSMGIKSVSASGFSGLANAANYAPSVAGAFNGNTYAMQMGDDRTPYTQTWNFTVSQQMPWKSILEATYSGNRSEDMLLTGNGSNVGYYANLNKIPYGALWGPDPITGAVYTAQVCDPASPANECLNPINVATGGVPSGQLQDYRPYANFGQAFNIISHGSYSNYHSLQMQWRKQTGPVTFTTNYTFSKVLGIRDGQTDNGASNGSIVDTFNLRNNYGVLAFDRTHVFNVAYVINLPSRIHDNPALAQVLNGWELSGVTQFQSGAPFQPNTSGNFNVAWSGQDIGNQQILGTDSTPLLPVLTCDPRSNLQSGQYFNPACFTGPQQGQNGQTIWPYIKGPAYVGNDLSLYKNFRVTERQKIQFRLNAFNFLNHALKDFTLDGTDQTIRLKGTRSFPDYVNGPITYTQINPNFTGKPLYETGRRVLELAIKYEF